MAARPTRTDRQAPHTTRGASSSRFRRGGAAIREAAGDAAPAYRRRAAGRHRLSPRPGLHRVLRPRLRRLLPPLLERERRLGRRLPPRGRQGFDHMPMCKPVCEVVLAPRPRRADRPEATSTEAPVPMLTLYTAGLDERPPARPERRLGRAGSHRRLTRRRGSRPPNAATPSSSASVARGGTARSRGGAIRRHMPRPPAAATRTARDPEAPRECPPLATGCHLRNTPTKPVPEDGEARTDREAGRERQSRTAASTGRPELPPRGLARARKRPGSPDPRAVDIADEIERFVAGEEAPTVPETVRVPVSMLTLYTAGLAERPQRGDDRFAVFAELARKVG